MDTSFFEYSSAEMQRVARVRFGVLSPDEIKAYSACEVQSALTYVNGVPVDGGLLDLRMGTMERNFRCKTCAMDMRECPGHFGHIELARPCLHVGFITTIVKVLRCVCFRCSKLLLSREHKNFNACNRIKNPKKRLNAILKVCQGMKRCSGGFDMDDPALGGAEFADAAASAAAAALKVEANGRMIDNNDILTMGEHQERSGCGNLLPQYRVEDGFKVMTVMSEVNDAAGSGDVETDRKKQLSAGAIHEILKRISADDCRTLGFDPLYARPDWFVITVLAVPPPPVRPSVMFNSSARSSDDLTYKLADIVKINTNLKRNEQQGAAEPILQDYSDLLQYHVCTLMDNEMSGQPQSLQRSGKPIKSIRQRIVGKAGRVRGNLMGKRCDFSARSVITPDPNLGIDQLGVPRTIAMNMTIPETVTAMNIGLMRKLVKNGPSTHPGAKSIIRDDGKLIDLRFVKKTSDLHLEVGYKVERHIDNNDPVVFNRQPSLHKMSMMGHRVRVMPWSTFRLNLSCTSPYNADFDGDEMNMHVPQCFPESDSRVLTDKGFLFLDQIEARIARGEHVLYACFQRNRALPANDADAMRGELVYRSGKLVFPPPPEELIAFNSSLAEAARWESAFEDKVAEVEESNVSLRVTPQHQMYVQSGSIHSGEIAWNKISVGNQLLNAPPEKIRAFDLLSECDCPAHELDCIHKRACVRFLSCADAGRQPSLEERLHVQQLVKQRLDLEEQQLPVFLRLFGFLIAAANQQGPTIEFCNSSADDIAWIDFALLAVGLKPQLGFERCISLAHQQQEEGVMWKITDQRWCSFFFSETEATCQSTKPTPITNSHASLLHESAESTRCLPDWVLRCLTPSEMGMIRDGLCRAGNEEQRRKAQISTSSAAFRDQVMQLLLLSGCTAFSQSSPQSLDASEHWLVSWSEPNNSSTQSACWPSLRCQQSITRQQYSRARDGRIWCVTVDHEEHLIVAQRAQRLANGLAGTQSRPIVVGQSYMTRAEIQEIILSPRQVVSPQANKPVMGIVQDTLLGCMKFTFRDTFLERDLTYNTLMNLESWDGHLPIPCILKPRPIWSGKQIFSQLLPKVNLNQTSNNHPDHEDGVMSAGDTLVRIEQGELLQGIIDKRTVGSSQGSLIHVTWIEYGPAVTAKLFTEIQKVVNHWLINNGFSIGIGDAIASESTLVQIEKTITTAKTDVQTIIKKARAGKLERTPGRSVVETFEQQVNEVLNKATNQAGKSVKSQLQYSNNVNAMVSAGSKGSSINICQIIACVGQQNVSGKRIPFGFKNRTLPHFCKDDLGQESRGFVANSYFRGLTPQEFYFHAMGGREGLIDTAVKTAETGYIQRRLVKAMEDVMVKYDHTVRNSLGDIIQFVYGEDAMAGEFIEKQRLEHVKCTRDKFLNMFQFEQEEDELAKYLDASQRADLQQPSVVTRLTGELHQLEKDRHDLRDRVLLTGDEGIYLPVNLKRLIWNAQKRFRVEEVSSSTANLKPDEILDEISTLCSKLVVVKGDDDISREAQKNATMLFGMALRSTFASKRVLKEHRLNRDAFLWLIGEIEGRFHQAISHPGEMVGAIAAQSIGEPATQMTLNTFHYAGVSSKNVTLGVPRLREIINVAATVKTPSLLVYLQPEFNRNPDSAKTVLNKLEFTTLAHVTEKTEIYYDADPELTVVEEDREFMSYYFELPDDDFSMTSASPWMLRIVLDRKKKENKDLTNSEIAGRINADWNGDLKAIYSNDNAAKLVLQIRFKLDDAGGGEKAGEAAEEQHDEDIFLKKVEENLLHSMELRGIKGITKVFMREEKVARFSPITEAYETAEQEWVLDTEGVALQRVMAVPEVNFKQTTSNVITEMFDVLGIEAARASLLKEVRAVIEFDGAYVNYRHLAMLCDVMTFRGHLMSITRHGINRNDTGPLMRCSFEETVEILVEAAAFSEADELKGVSENIMVGNLAPIGTGSFDLLLNQKMLEENKVEAPLASAFSNDAMYEALYSGANDGIYAGTPTQEFDSASSILGASYSPLMSGGDAAFSPYMSPSYSSGGASPAGGSSPNYSPSSPQYHASSSSYSPTSPSANFSPTSPGGYSPTSPKNSYSPTSPAYSPGTSSRSQFSPTSPANNYSPSNSYSPQNSGRNYSPTSPSYSPTSPSYSPTSPSYSPTSPSYSPTSPSYSPTSPSYSPTSPSYSPTSPSYSPTSPSYSPTSPAANYSPSQSYSPGGGGTAYSPTSPSYSPTSPSYSPTSPSYSPTSPSGSYSPSSVVSPASTASSASHYSPTSPSYSPTSPSYSPTSPSYSPTSPSYSPTSPGR